MKVMVAPASGYTSGQALAAIAEVVQHKFHKSGYDSKGKSVKYISAPKITKAESVDGGVKISWNKSNGAEQYRVYYKGRKGWTRMVDTTSTSL